MQSIISQAEIIGLSTGALRTLIHELEGELARRGYSPEVHRLLQTALRAARAELGQRQANFAPKPPGFL